MSTETAAMRAFRTALFLLLCAASALAAGMLLEPAAARAATLRDAVQKGTELYDRGGYDEALNAFVDAQIENPEDPRLKYNIASAKYRMKNYDEALNGYLDVAATARDVRLEEKALFNAGNALYRQGKLQEAIDYYKKALELDPEDTDAKKNIEFVRQEIKRRMNQAKKTQQKQQEQQQQNKDQTCRNPQQDNQTKSGGQQEQQQQEKQEQQDRQKQAAQQEDQEQKKDGQQGRQAAGAEKQEQGKQQASAAEGPEMSKEEAQQWLDSVRENRDHLKQDSRASRARGGAAGGKDW